MTIQFIGGTAQQQAAIEAAHAALQAALTTAQATPMSPRLLALFGSSGVPSTISTAYSTALTALTTQTFTWDLRASLPTVLLDGVCAQITTSGSGAVSLQLVEGFWTNEYLDSTTFGVVLAASLFHELAIVFGGLVDFAGVVDEKSARALAHTSSASALSCAVNYAVFLRPLLEKAVTPSPPGGLALASSGNALGFVQTTNGSTIGSLPPLLTNGPLTARPASYGRIAVFGEGDTGGPSQLHAYDVYEGTDLWMMSPPAVSGSVDSTPAVAGNMIWLCTGDGALVQVDMTNPGAPAVTSLLSFMNGTNTSRVTGCCLSDDEQTLYATTTLGAYAITLGASPSVAWSAATTTDVSGVQPVLIGNVLVGANASTLYGWKGSANDWSLGMSAPIQVLLSNGASQILVNSSGDTFAIVETTSQSVQATWAPGMTGICFAQSLLVGNLLFLTDASGHLGAWSYVFINQTNTWTSLWSTTLAQPASVAPAFANGLLYVQDGSGALYAFDALSGTQIWKVAGTPVATTAPLNATAWMNIGDAALYPTAGYGGTPVLTSSAPSSLPAVAGFVPGPQSTYTLFSTSSTALNEVFFATPQVSLSQTPTLAATYAASTIGAIVQSQGLSWSAAESRSWLADIANNRYSLWFVIDTTNAVFGPNVAMLDFDGSSLALARSVAPVVALGGEGSTLPAGVQTGLAMSGSTAQDAVQANPGDLDFTERIHITASCLADAQQILGQIVKTRATTAPSAPGVTAQLVELKFGAYPFDFRASGGSSVQSKGSPIAWTPAQITSGQISGTNVTTGQPATITWAEAQANPGWIKFDWIFSKPATKDVMNTSNVLDPTWQDPAGTIASLDGDQDAFLQEIYLHVTAAPLVATLYAALGGDLKAHYLAQLELEVKKFGTPGTKKYNMGKVAKRLYNLTRMNGRFLDASYLRAIFSAPITVVYQVWSRVKGIGEAAQLTSISHSDITAQTQALITALQAQTSLDPTRSAQLVSDLQAIVTALQQSVLPSNFPSLIATCQAHALSWSNDVFATMIAAVPGLQAYVQALVSRGVSAPHVAAQFRRIYEGPEDWEPAPARCS